MSCVPHAAKDAERWNDAFAREHDINEYYSSAGFLIRVVENSRLRRIRQMLQARPGERVLEVGCGGGHVLRMFPQCELTGVDVSGEMLAKARQNLSGFRVQLHKGELPELHLARESFDRMICSEVLEHVVEPQDILKGMRELLSPGGIAVITIPNDALIHRIKRLIRLFRLDALPPLHRIAWGGDQYHLHAWTAAEMKSLLDQYFRVIQIRCAPNPILPIRLCFAVTQKN